MSSLKLGKKDWKQFTESKKILKENNYFVKSFEIITDLLKQKDNFSENELSDIIDWLTDINTRLEDHNTSNQYTDTFSTIELSKWTFIIKKLKEFIKNINEQNIKGELLHKLNYLIRQQGNGADQRHSELSKQINRNDPTYQSDEQYALAESFSLNII